MAVSLKPVIRDSLSGKGQDLGGKTFYGNPGENKEPSVRGHEIEVFLFGSFIPPDEGFAGFHSLGGRDPPKTCYGSIIDEGDVFEMIPDNLPIPQVVMVLDQAVVQRFKIGSANQREGNRWKPR